MKLSRTLIENIRKLIRPGMVVAMCTAFPLIGVMSLGVYGNTILDFLGGFSDSSRFLFVSLAGGALVGTAFFPTHAISLLAGWLFGGALGSLVALLAISLGALIGFFLGGYLAGGSVVEIIRSHDLWSRIYEALMDNKKGRASILIGLLRISPLAPFAATNVAFAALGTPLAPFLYGSILGMAPRALIVVFLGASLAEFNWDNPSSPYIAGIGILATIAALWMISRITKGYLKNHA